MEILFQEGIPDIFFSALKEEGCSIVRFPTDKKSALKIFLEHDKTYAIFFRANFTLDSEVLTYLPNLHLAALVSTGSDNIDIGALKKRDTKLVTGEGANAQAVFDYVMQALLFGGFNPQEHRVGVVGKGRIGSRVVDFLRQVNVDVLFYDPFLPASNALTDVLQCDFVTFHVPLTTVEKFATEKMLNKGYFTPVQKRIRIVQSCRGKIWDIGFYSRIHEHPFVELLAQDVYPIEPPYAKDLKQAKFSTPHIAGYSTLGRLGGIYRGISALFPGMDLQNYYPKSRTWNIKHESENLSKQVEKFNAIRDNYFWRKEFHEYNVDEQADFRVNFPRIEPRFFDTLFAYNPSL
ncbi:MAG: Erythronate-4-phosphate dehydrogenase [Turneriella sp.]|nr:Erythronate-4-phosphate dehydrogenase [Turneriella sp.]